MNNYQISEYYRDNEVLRNEFYKYTETVFPGINFREWYSKGFWQDNYNPVSLIDRSRVIANVSCAKMKILLNGLLIDGIQIGAVGTIPDYRGQGLARKLMSYVLEKFEDSAELIFLFANDDVYDFYPKFGFEKVDEVYYSLESDIPAANFSARNLDINNPEDFSLIRRLIDSRQDLTQIFGAREYGFVIFWHILNVHPNNLYYLADEDVIVIKTEKDNQVYIWDIIFSRPFDLAGSLSKIIQSERIRTINYYFPPDRLNFHFDKIVPLGDYALFVRGKFNIKDMQFKFPVTAET